ncbi:MAG: hypothetical protein J5569_07495 [Oscillospiraceae bacterium]|nr:hypothetical protein [Oscillospiraceae bacterium]
MRRSNTLLIVISVLFLIAIICYIGLNLIQSGTDPLRTAPAVSCTVEDSCEAVGYAVRTESVLTAEGYVASDLADGEHVSYGQSVATRYGSEEALALADEIRSLRLQISQIENSIMGRGDAMTSVISLSRAVEDRDLQRLDQLAMDVRANIFSRNTSGNPEAELAALTEQLRTLQDQTSDADDVRVFSSGTFSSAVDGYERIAPSDLEGLQPSDLEDLFSGPEIPQGAFGKLISGTTWYFASRMNSADAQRLSPGGTALVKFNKTFSADLTMDVVSVSEAANGMRLVVFSSDRDLEKASGLRRLTADIVFAQESGLLVPKEAVHDDDGTYIYILAGYQAMRTDIEVISDYDEEYCLIRPAENGTLAANASVIVSARGLFDGKVVQ